MSDYSRKLLRKKIKEAGCVEPLVWNENTGNLVSGHHRLHILDELEGSLDYMLGVAVVNLSTRREKEMNVFLNNSQAQGTFDKDLFLAMMLEEPLDIADMGFTRIDLELSFGDLPELFGEGPSVMKVQDDAIAGVLQQAERLDPRADSQNQPPPAAPAVLSPEQIAKMKELKKSYKADTNDTAEHDARYYILVTFEGHAQKESFLQKLGYPVDIEYLSAQELGLVERAMQVNGPPAKPYQRPVDAARQQLDELIGTG